jgi:hypothetical protein
MTTIFLDIDGCLTHMAMYKQKAKTIEEKWPFDKKCVKVLNKYCKKTNAKIVISSDWRIGRSLEFLQKLLKKRGVKAEVIGKTQLMKLSGGPRGDEICDWIENSNCKYDEEFVVIDDNVEGIVHIQEYFKLGQMTIIHIKEGWTTGGLQEEHLFEEKSVGGYCG